MTNPATKLADQLRALLARDVFGVPAATMSDVMRAQAEAVLLSCGNVAALAEPAPAVSAVQPLTDKRISEIYRQHYPESWMADGSLRRFARAIEAAHGIGPSATGGANG